VMGVSLGVGVPGEGTVSGSKLSNPFNYDSGLLYLDGTNDRVGIGTTNPTTKLDVGGIVLANGINITGVTTVAAGSTAAPSITPTGDSNTGIFFPSADTIAFSEGGTEALRIDNSGRVGIGTDNPIVKLDVFGNAYIGGVGGDAYFITYADVSGSNVSIEAINRANTIKKNLTLCTYGGNVGIGITNPGCSLQINGGVRARGGAPGSGGVNNNGYAFSGGSGDNDSGMFSSADGQLEFYVNSSEALRITPGRALYVTQTPGSYTIDTTAEATSIANNGTVDFPNASGMLIVNNHNSGAITIYLCGGGVTVVVSNVTTQVGTFTFIPGIGGYRWTNNSGSTATFGFFFVRTRTFA